MTEAHTLEELVESLRSQGQVDSAGGFHVDIGRARQLLSEYRLDRKDLWLVPLVQAAHLWEAARVVVSFERTAAVVEILACQCPPDLSPWLRAVGDPKHIFHPVLGPLVLACEVALAAGFGAIELTSPESRPFWLQSSAAEGDASEFEQVRQLKIRLFSPARPWWQLKQKREWSGRIVRASQSLRQRASFSLAQPMIEGVDLKPDLECAGTQAGPDEVERVWLSRQPLRQLMAYPGPSLRPFSHDWVGRRLTRWQQPGAQGLLRQWVPAEKTTLGSDLHLSKAEHWVKYLVKNQTVTLPREVRLREGYLAARGVLQWNPKSRQPGRLIPLRWGVSLGVLELPNCTGVSAWLSADSWSTDLSQQKVLRNALVEKSVQFVQAQFAALLDEIVEAAHVLPEGLQALLTAVYMAKQNC